MVIYKFPLAPRVRLPQDAILLSVGLDPADTLCLWCIVDPYAECLESEFKIIGTGQHFELGDQHFLGTVRQGAFMWHIFTNHPAELIRC